MVMIEPGKFSIITNLHPAPAPRNPDPTNSNMVIMWLKLDATERDNPRDDTEPKEMRHEWQRELLSQSTTNTSEPAPVRLNMSEFPSLAGFSMVLNQRYALYDVRLSEDVSNKSSIEGGLYLFHVIVALEWQPSTSTLMTLMYGLRAASDALYDATNGSMAFGQVTFCGRTYMAGADIQVLASNRFHPRSMVDALNDESKFFPIRIGRGVWHKNNRVLTPWDEPIATRVIAHEWAHYALSLHDLYIDYARKVSKRGYRLIDDEKNGSRILVVPKVRLSIESLMATLEASEIVPLQYSSINAALRKTLLNKFEEHYNTTSVDKLLKANTGPHHFPGALPQFYHTADIDVTGNSAEEILLDVGGIGMEHCWLYTLSWDNQTLHRIIAQGTIDARAQGSDDSGVGYAVPSAGQRLLGATLTVDPHLQSEVLAIGLMNNKLMTKRLILPQSDAYSGSVAAGETSLVGTPGDPISIEQPPVVAVLPSLSQLKWPNVKVSVQVVSRQSLTHAWLAVPGAPINQVTLRPQSGVFSSAEINDVKHLDGLILLQLPQEGQPLWVAEYSHGGNPPTSVRDPGAPLSAGSADGNLMIFCRDDQFDPETGANPDNSAYQTRIVTTRNYGGFEDTNPGEPCSYLFSVAANQRIDRFSDAQNPEVAHDLHPTMVLYYDADTLTVGTDLVIFRFDQDTNSWQEVPTYLPPGAFYAAAAMDQESAPHLTKPDLAPDKRVEFYRLFAIPRW